MSQLRKPSYWLALLATWLLLTGIYFLFTSNVQKEEVYVGFAAGLVATIASAIFDSLGIVTFRPRMKDLLQAWRMPLYMFQGTWELLHALCLQIFTRHGTQSMVLAVPFQDGGDNPTDSARRALAVFYTTATPNFVVLGIIREQHLMLYHQVQHGPVLKMTVNLGAGA